MRANKLSQVTKIIEQADTAGETIKKGYLEKLIDIFYYR
jgi:hypothetical protein